MINWHLFRLQSEITMERPQNNKSSILSEDLDSSPHFLNLIWPIDMDRKKKNPSESHTISFLMEKSRILKYKKSMSDHICTPIIPIPKNMSQHISTQPAREHHSHHLLQKEQCYFIYIWIYIQMNNIQVEYDENLPPNHDLKYSSIYPRIKEHSNLHLHQLQGRKLGSDVMSLKFDRDGEFLAFGSKNGTRILYSTIENKYVSRFDDVRDNTITSLKWRPSTEGKNKILVSADAGGFITFHHIPTLKPLFTIAETDNSIHTIDYSPVGRHFATGGKDFHVRIYDQDTKSLTIDLKPAGWNNVGHDNRVFAVRFIDENTLISGGWDSVVHIWDLRQGRSARHFYGPNISGQSLDYQNGLILAGCYAAQRQLQLYDVKSLKKVEEIDWSGDIDDAQYIYCASFNRHDPAYFGAGSTGPNSQLRLYREREGEEGEGGRYAVSAEIKGLNQGCFSLDFSSKISQFAFSTPHHGIYVYEYEKK